MIKISCIVPVYNVEKYLRRCLDSILKQTFKDFELIIVDDGSTDGCPNICDEYEKIDERVFVIHQKNGGLSNARNTGIEKAVGKYLLFIDSDDYIAENMLEAMYLANETNDTKICMCDKAFVFENTGVIEYGKETNNIYKYSSNEAFLKIVDFYDKVGMEMWNKLYSRDLFKKVRFPDGKIFEDQATQYKLIFQVETVSYIQKSLYYYVRRSNSITTQKYNEKEKLRLEMVNQMTNYIRDHHHEIISSVVLYKILSCNFTIINKMIKSNCYDKVFLKEVINDMKKESKYLKNNSLNLTRKIQLFLIINNFPLYKIMYKLMYGRKEY